MVRLDQVENVALKVKLDSQVHQDLQDHLDQLVQLDQQDPKVEVVKLVTVVRQDKLDL